MAIRAPERTISDVAGPKVSIITAVYNRCDIVRHALESVQIQTFESIEHVVIDGASSDGTLEILESCLDERATLVSEPDRGIYDALNKGIALASGDVIGLLHSDDYFADGQVIAEIMSAFEDPLIDAVYGDLEYVAKSEPNRVIRHWKAGEFSPKKLARGWMPPHPTLFVRREVIERFGGFDAGLQIAADYDAVLRYFGPGQINAKYIPRVLVKMRVGGESNRSLARVIRKSWEDYQALHRNRVGGLWALFLKNVSKIPQFFRA